MLISNLLLLYFFPNHTSFKPHHPSVIIYKILYYLSYIPVISLFTFLSNQYGDFRTRICWWIWILSLLYPQLHFYRVIHHHFNRGYNILGERQSLEVTNQISSYKLLSTLFKELTSTNIKLCSSPLSFFTTKGK